MLRTITLRKVMRWKIFLMILKESSIPAGRFSVQRRMARKEEKRNLTASRLLDSRFFLATLSAVFSFAMFVPAIHCRRLPVFQPSGTDSFFFIWRSSAWRHVACWPVFLMRIPFVFWRSLAFRWTWCATLLYLFGLANHSMNTAMWQATQIDIHTTAFYAQSFQKKGDHVIASKWQNNTT